MRGLWVWMLACSSCASSGTVTGFDSPIEAIDADADGYYAAGNYGNDCDDADPAVHPDALDESCDGVDNDCYHGDGPDADGDLASSCADDCDDNDASRAPGLAERCNSVDDDCDLAVDEDFDQDGDGVLDCGPGFGPLPVQVGEAGDLGFGAALVVIDLDQDGVDEVVTGGGGATPNAEPMGGGRVWLFYDEGGCSLCGLRSLDGEAISGLLAAGDVNGDGFEDVLASGDPFISETREHWLLLGHEGPELGAPVALWSDRVVMTAVALGDVTNDGFDDLAAIDLFGTVTLFAGSRFGLVEDRVLGSFPELGDMVTLRAAEVTGDGLIDLVATAALEFAGTRLWTLPWGETQAVMGGAAVSDRTVRAAVEVATGGDLDGDGVGDVLYLLSAGSGTMGEINGAYAVARGAADGTLLDTGWRLPMGAGIESAAISPDLDGDGLSDVLLLRAVDGGVLLQAWTGWPTPVLLSEALVPGPAGGFFNAVEVAVGDVDGDGATDILVSAGGPLWVFHTTRDCDDHDPSVTTSCP